MRRNEGRSSKGVPPPPPTPPPTPPPRTGQARPCPKPFSLQRVAFWAKKSGTGHCAPPRPWPAPAPDSLRKVTPDTVRPCPALAPAALRTATVPVWAVWRGTPNAEVWKTVAKTRLFAAGFSRKAASLSRIVDNLPLPDYPCAAHRFFLGPPAYVFTSIWIWTRRVRSCRTHFTPWPPRFFTILWGRFFASVQKH